MNKYLIILGVLMVTAAIAPFGLEKISKPNLQENTKLAPQEQNQVRPRAKKVSYNKPTKQLSRGRTTKITADRRGHFLVTAKLNGKKSKVLVDTGATYVAINESTAKKLGIQLKAKDFKYKVNTANGVTYAAAAMIDEIKIGKIRVKNVQASVSRDKALKTTLLGMSFLNKLDKFVIEGQTLTMKQ